MLLAVAKDFYAVLGVSKDASPEDIKAAYRKMSKEWHPDKHKGEKAAETKFKEINEAYEVLGNPQKKQMYDQFGSTGGPGAGGNGNFSGFSGFDFSSFNQGGQRVDFGDLFETFFGAGGGRGRPEARNRGEDREAEVTIAFADAVAGKRISLKIRTVVECEKCSASGAEAGSKVVTCPTCGGTGQVTRSAQSFFGQIQQRTICDTCSGAGKIPEKPCSNCKGEGRVRGEREVTIDVPAGISDGQTMKVTGKGDAGARGAEPGDLYVHVRVQPDTRFDREGDDVRSTAVVSVIDAILGAELQVPTVHGAVTVSIPAGMQPGQIFRLKSKGMPVLNTSRHGDHYVRVEVEIPRKLSREEKRILEEWRQAKG